MSPRDYPDELAAMLHSLDELTNWEHRPRGAMVVGIAPVLDLLRRLDNPHHGFRTVHVTGTKGKGSVCALLEAALNEAGLSVGRYASPHLQRVNERISIGCVAIADRQLVEAVGCALDAFRQARGAGTDGKTASWFDVVTAAAFVAFRDAGLDWVIVEVGLGGRLDSTNVINAEVAVITNVELEHTEVLGKTRAEIAREKGGILKRDATLITTLTDADDAGKILHAEAQVLGCAVICVPPVPGFSIEESNAQLAGEVLNQLGYRGVLIRSECGSGRPVGAWLLNSSVRSRARLPGRLEQIVVHGKRLAPVSVVLDGAHVPFNLEAVLRDLTNREDLRGDCVAVVGMAADKDAAGLLLVLARHATHLVFTELPPPGHGLSCETLQMVAASFGLSSETQVDLRAAMERGLLLAARSGGWLLVTGSLRLVGAVRNLDGIAAS
ncbi:bifunctional folylpolyglutamate synthase/dihydrofolate synthase [Paraburkholderia sacchari]|uniref:bifunctional folylpolyglutamate synthase/dihydrofolate synthase n=1 Tax=Paraburkholderia sacchari TaxID=159450 RepID=UPI003D95637A